MQRRARAAIWGCAAFLLSPSAALSQSLGGAPDDGVSSWRVAGALVFCLAAGVAGAFLLRSRIGQGQLLTFAVQRRRRLALVETVRLSSACSLAIVSCDGEECLVSISQQNTTVVAWLPRRERQSSEQGPA